jgi:hypothetical protein
MVRSSLGHEHGGLYESVPGFLAGVIFNCSKSEQLKTGRGVRSHDANDPIEALAMEMLEEFNALIKRYNDKML